MAIAATGKAAPAFELRASDGKSHSLAQALAQGPVLAAFFKVACPTCQFTFPFVERLHQQYRQQGGQVWGISQDDAGDSQRFAKTFGVTFPILIDPAPYKTSRQYGLQYVPTLFLIAPGGQVEFYSEGFAKADLLEIQRRLASHLSSSPGALFLPTERIPEYKPG
jgi:peroxiredoxin